MPPARNGLGSSPLLAKPVGDVEPDDQLEGPLPLEAQVRVAPLEGRRRIADHSNPVVWDDDSISL